MKDKKKKVKKPKKQVRKKTIIVKAKRFPGTISRAPRSKLIGDSYQANERDLKKMRRVARRLGISKAQLIRYGCSLALQVYEALAAGKKKLTINLGDL